MDIKKEAIHTMAKRIDAVSRRVTEIHEDIISYYDDVFSVDSDKLTSKHFECSRKLSELAISLTQEEHLLDEIGRSLQHPKVYQKKTEQVETSETKPFVPGIPNAIPAPYYPEQIAPAIDIQHDIQNAALHAIEGMLPVGDYDEDYAFKIVERIKGVFALVREV